MLFSLFISQGTMMQPGVYADLTNDQYHGGVGVSKSMLDIIANSSPLHLYAIRNADNDNVRQPTPAQVFGTAFHALLLEPAVFAKEYCLGLRQQDAPDAVADKETLVAMVAKLNEGRLPKLATGGTKDELVERVLAAMAESGEEITPSVETTIRNDWKAANLKAEIQRLNETRPGLLSDRGTMAELRDILNANGHQVTLWADVKAKWLENNGHRTVLSPEDWDALHNMRDAVMAHPPARAIMEMDGSAEHSVYWNDAGTGTLCRCRPDWWVKSRGLVLDVKTTTDASPEEFRKSIAGWRYHVQHAMYVDGLNAAREQIMAANQGEEFPAPVHAPVRHFVFLAVEKTARVVNGQPMGVAVYRLEPQAVELGRMLYRQDVATYAECDRTGVWPGYGDAIQSLDLPGWEYSRNAA